MLSPLAPAQFPTLSPVAGVRLATAEAGVRYANRKDVLLVELCEGTVAAGVLTRSLTASAAVLACRESLNTGQGRLLVVNSGNSNAFTGKAGEDAVLQIQQAAAKWADCKVGEIFTASTGVIGEPLPVEKITAALPSLSAQLKADGWAEAAASIMTTDTYTKMATRKVPLSGVEVTLNGFAKGSGMIAPDMATMLAFIFTDAAIAQPELQAMLEKANATTFNAITVDGDTSTSDTCLLFATGKVEISQAYDAFYEALHSLMLELALLIVRDGEGAEKLVEIRVSGAESDHAARRIGMSIGNSPLVKTALAASDANWGRIVAAIGKAGEKAERDALTLKIGGVSVAEKGAVAAGYKEAMIAAHMQGRELLIEVDVGVGSGAFTTYGCDLTHRYIDINANYRS